MPSPVVPNDVKSATPSPTGNFCERFAKALTLPKLFHSLVNWMITEDGNINPDGMGADICALECFGGSGTVGGGTGTVFGFPQNVSASDGQYQDKVAVNWSSVFGATEYDVYRNASNNTDTATLVGTTSSTSFEDTTADPGTTYYYWIRARNDTQVSNYSNSDQGYMAVTLTAISDLTASKGFSRGNNPYISLVFTPPASSNQYDIYMSATNDFATAVILDSNRTPFDNSASLNLCSPTPCTKAVFLDNGGELLYIYKPTSVNDFFGAKYFWVKAKNVSSGTTIAISEASNSAEGWAIGKGDGVIPLSDASLTSAGAELETPAGATEAWIVMFGGGAGGAGGDVNNGGGGGGAGSTIVGWIEAVAGSRLRLVSTPESDTSNAATTVDGEDGPITEVEYSEDGTFTDTVVLFTGNAPTGGQFVNGDDGDGGVGASGSVDALVNDSVIYDGRDGKPADGLSGGRGGNRFGGLRRQPAHWNGFAALSSDNGDGGTIGAGGGTYASPIAPALAVGGKGSRGFAYVIYRA